MNLEVNENNVRLDVYLTNNTELSRTKIQKLIKEGNILVNNKVCPSNYKVKEKDLIEIENICDENIDTLPEKMDLDIQVSKLKVLKQSYLSEHYDLEDRILKHYPQTIKEYEQRIVCYEADTVLAEQNKPQGEEKFCAMTLRGIKYTEKAAAGEMLLAICKEYPLSTPTEIGSYRGFKMEVFYDTVNAHYCLNLCGKAKYKVDLGFDPLGNLTRIENELAKLPARLEAAKTKRTETIAQFETAKVEVQKPFAFEGELKEKSERLNALNIELNLDKKDPAVLDAEPEQSEEQPERKCENRER